MNLLLAHLAAQVFFSSLWQGAVLVFAVSLALRLLPRLTPTIRFIIWSATFLAATTIPLIHLTPQGVSANQIPTLHLGLEWVLAIAACWITLSTIRLTRLTLNALHLCRIGSNATPLTAPADIQAILDTAPRHPELCLSKDVDSPSVIGFLAPRLLIPESLYPTLTQPELRQIVLHECEHLRRRDDWINLLQKLALALFPLNPALWLADRRLGLERELACDAAVTASASPIAYAQALTRLAEHRIFRRPLTLALSAWGHQSELARRVYTILRPTSPISPLRTRTTLAILSTALAAGAFELAQSPRLVSFTEPVHMPLAETTNFTPSTQNEAPKAVPVVYHPPTAIQTIPSLRQPARRVSNTRRPARPIAVVPQSRIILTQTRDIARPPRIANPAYLLTTGFVPTYAAVPFADGWLIIQL